MKNIFILLVSIIVAINSFGQNIRFSQSVVYNGLNTTVTFQATNIGATPENLGGFTLHYYYNNAETTISSVNFTPTSGSWGTANQDIINHQPNSNGSVPITHTGFFFYQNLDNNFIGFNIPASGSITLGSVTFNNSIGTPNGGSGFISSTTQDPPIRYLNLPSGQGHFILTTGSQSIALPISLHSFKAEKHSDRSAKLNWITSSELNSSHFDIERSHDGGEWTYVGQVTAAGNSSTTREYSFIDDQLPLNRTKNQIFYYRLRMVDQDGAFKYSDIRGVNFSINDRGTVSIYPNPASAFVNIDMSDLDFDIHPSAHLSIYDMSGRLMMQKEVIGAGIEPVMIAQLPAEAYNVVIRHGDQHYSRRLIVTK